MEVVESSRWPCAGWWLQVKTLRRRWSEDSARAAVDADARRLMQLDPLFELMEQCWGGLEQQQEAEHQTSDSRERREDEDEGGSGGENEAEERTGKRQRSSQAEEAQPEEEEQVAEAREGATAADGFAALGETLRGAIAAASTCRQSQVERIAIALERQQEAMREHLEETRAQNRAIQAALLALLDRLAKPSNE